MKLKQFVVITAIFSVSLLLTSCSENKIKKEHTGISAEYESFLFEEGKLNDIQISMTNWAELVQEASERKPTGLPSEQAVKKDYYHCDVIINDEEYRNTGIRTKGVYTLIKASEANSEKYSLVLKFNEFEKQKYHGIRMIDLNNNIIDATSMKDAVTYDMCRFIGLPAPLCNYAKITVNGKFLGCYLAVEPVGKDFCKRNFGEDYGSLYKPLHNLNYTGFLPKNYKLIKDMVKINHSSFSNVTDALKSVHKKKNIEDHVDVDSVLKYMAVQTIVVNMDGLTGDLTRNYYLYESDGKISLIPWDYDMAFGGKMMADDKMFSERIEKMENRSFNKKEWLIEKEQAYADETRQIINLPIDTPFTGDLSEREFFMNILANTEYKEKYYEYLFILAKDYIQGGELENTINKYANEISDIVGTEQNVFYSSEDFEPAVDMLNRFLQKKAESVIGQLDGTIPSECDKQEKASDKLIDTSGIDVIVMGSSTIKNKQESDNGIE